MRYVYESPHNDRIRRMHLRVCNFFYVLHKNEQNTHLAWKIRTFWMVLTLSKACLRV